MLVLLETAAGIAIFKVNDIEKIRQVNNLYKFFETPEGAAEIVTPKSYDKFCNRTEAFVVTLAGKEGKLCRPMKKSITKHVVKDPGGILLVSDARLALAIKNAFSISVDSGVVANELVRCIKLQVNSLLKGKPQEAMDKLCHEPEIRVEKLPAEANDTNIILAQNALDKLEKDINVYERQIKEAYGFHFPELQRILPVINEYIKFIDIVGYRNNLVNADLSELKVYESTENNLKRTAAISVGKNIKPAELRKIRVLSRRISSMLNYEEYLTTYVESKMMNVAPNISALVGVHTGARFIARAGSLFNLAMRPASNLQLLGAEKSLYRAQQNNTNTPSHGLILHTDMVGQVGPQNKKKVARMLAGKLSLAARADAFSKNSSPSVGIQQKLKLESRINSLDQAANLKEKKSKRVVTGPAVAAVASGSSRENVPPRAVGAGDCKSILKKDRKNNDNDPGPSGDNMRRSVRFNLRA